MEYVLKTEGLTKTYRKVNAVDNLSLTVKPGDIYGFVGKNGAGKTTLIRMVLGLAKPTSGTFSLFDGQDPAAARRRIGSLIEGPALYRNLNAKDNLLLYSTMIGADPADADTVLEQVGLKDTGKKKVHQFSLGMKQRLGIAMALVGDPDLLILDEPINGLDPKGIVEIRELLVKLKEAGKTIFISSHILGELEKIATVYGIISSGKLVEQITAEELKKLCVERTLIRTDAPEKALEVVKRITGSEAVITGDGSVAVTGEIGNIGELTNAMFKENIIVSGISSDSNRAEEYFINKMEEVVS